MGKRSDFDRVPHDCYDTPRGAVAPLLPYLPQGTEFAEPCAGRGFLIDHLTAEGHRCVWATDIEPRRDDIGCLNAMAIPRLGMRNIRAQMFITNPPWTRNILHSLIERLSPMLPCWFLFDADWAHTRLASELILRCSLVVPIGRVKWIPGSKHTGKENACWYHFPPGHTAGPQLVPRGAATARGQYHVMMGPDERRRAEIKAFGAVSDPGPLFEIGGANHGAAGLGDVSLVRAEVAQLKKQRKAREVAPDAGSHHPSDAGRHENGQMLQSVQSGQGADDADGMGGVHEKASDILARLRSGLRSMVLPTIAPGDIEQ